MSVFARLVSRSPRTSFRSLTVAMSFCALLACAGVTRPSTPAADLPIDGDATAMLSPQQFAALPETQRTAWQRYRAHSDELRTRDRASMEAELRAAGLQAMTAAPNSRGFRVEKYMTAEWFRGDDAARMADNVASFQTPSGGWSKHVDVSRPRKPGESYFSENTSWHYIATIDNDSTTEQLRFLAAAYAGRSAVRPRESFLKGIDYLLQAQFPNGCWPQVYPLQGGYHDAATYNDDAIVNVLRLLEEVGAGKFVFVSADKRRRAQAAVAQGVDCILASQVVVGGARTVWAQQHHPLTLAPVPARSYELAGLSGRESATIALYLMERPAADERVITAVGAAVEWFRKHQILGYEYDTFGLRSVEGAGPLWARLYEIGTDKPIFSNRDGVKRYDWNELTDRRTGYGWYTKEPARVIARFETWALEHPVQGAAKVQR